MPGDPDVASATMQQLTPQEIIQSLPTSDRIKSKLVEYLEFLEATAPRDDEE